MIGTGPEPIGPDPASEGEAARVALVVDDDADARAGIEGMLSRLGFEVHSAGGPDDAMAVVEEEDSLHLLVVDVIMPTMNGLVLARRVADRRPGVRVLYVSGLTSGEVLGREGESSAVQSEFIEKPISLDELSSAVRALFDQGG